VLAFVVGVQLAGSAVAAQPAQAPQIDRIPQGLDPGRPLRALRRVAERRVSERATERYDPIFRKYTKRYFGIGGDWRRFKAQGMAESDLVPTARSWVGARGIMQLMPSTYQAIASRRSEMKSIDDPEWNIAAGIMHDRYLWRMWEKEVPEQERWHFMFASYNAGEGTITRAHEAARTAKLDHDAWESIAGLAPTVRRWRYRETLGYVQKIRKNYTVLESRREETGNRK
jgi:membrane-bound lytic murein transglycosylase F